MKLNWGYKILIVYAFFVAGILCLVYLSSKQNKDLVAENYYAEELKYQKIIDQSSNTASLSSPLELHKQDNEIKLYFPSEFFNVNGKGNWLLYYAADIALDQSGTFELKHGEANIVLPHRLHGLYTLKLSWHALDKDFYFEQDITF